MKINFIGRGISSSIVHYIILEAGEKVHFPIIYDDKVKDKISKLDIIKAKDYKRINNTEYCIIVTSECIGQNLIDNMEGILIISKSVVTKIVSLIRSFIIEISNLKIGEYNKESKQKNRYLNLEIIEITYSILTNNS